jgi:hypothetical protein
MPDRSRRSRRPAVALFLLACAAYVLSPPSGALIAALPGTYQGTTVITKPIGSAVDSKGNVWVANSDWLVPFR